jgi:16S rRNA A1518/A1519 N6-dimethyltransferase RsmA/KsgA/DIM1 with predicted DNA glycosylase/AP lyase activity
LRAAAIDPAARGETLAIADYVRLANVLSEPGAWRR